MESRLNVGPSPGSRLESPVDRGAWRATVQGVTQSQAQVTEQRAAHPQETRAPEPARQHAPPRSLPCTAPGSRPGQVGSGRVGSGQVGVLRPALPQGAGWMDPLPIPAGSSPQTPQASAGTAPRSWVLGDAHHVSPQPRKGPGLGVLHPQQGALVDPGRMRWGVCRPLSSPGTREGHSSPSRQVLAVVMG